MYNNETFEDGAKIISIIEKNGWVLYDTTYSPSDRAYTWEELEDMPIATELSGNHNYMFVPRREEGKTLRETYRITMGLGPSFLVENLDDDLWIALRFHMKKNGPYVLFTRIFMDEKFMILTSPSTEFLEKPDIIAFNYDDAASAFESHYKIVLPEDFGLTASLPMPQKKDLN